MTISQKKIFVEFLILFFSSEESTIEVSRLINVFAQKAFPTDSLRVFESMVDQGYFVIKSVRNKSCVFATAKSAAEITKEMVVSH